MTVNYALFSLRKRGIDKWKQVLYETKNIHN